MAYRIRAMVNLDWVGPGAGPMEALNPTGGNLPGGGSTGQTLQVRSANTPAEVIVGTGAGGALASGDITSLLSALTADLSAQLNAQIATPQGWVSGNP